MERKEIESYVEYDTNGGCWLWSLAPTRHGYAQVKREGKTHRVNRLSFLAFKGSIPDGMQVCHSCDVRLCVNPDHLWLGGASENRLDCVSKGRGNIPKGSDNGRSKLLLDQVREIRRLCSEGFTQAEVSRMFSIDASTVSDIKRGKSWAWA